MKQTVYTASGGIALNESDGSRRSPPQFLFQKRQGPVYHAPDSALY